MTPDQIHAELLCMSARIDVALKALSELTRIRDELSIMLKRAEEKEIASHEKKGKELENRWIQLRKYGNVLNHQ